MSSVWMVANILIMLAVAGRRRIVGEVEKTLKPKRFFRIATFEIIIKTHNNQQHTLITPTLGEKRGDTW